MHGVNASHWQGRAWRKALLLYQVSGLMGWLRLHKHNSKRDLVECRQYINGKQNTTYHMEQVRVWLSCSFHNSIRTYQTRTITEQHVTPYQGDQNVFFAIVVLLAALHPVIKNEAGSVRCNTTVMPCPFPRWWFCSHLHDYFVSQIHAGKIMQRIFGSKWWIVCVCVCVCVHRDWVCQRAARAGGAIFR